MTVPTDGYGVYEAWHPGDTANANARLDQIAAGGFKLVMNYTLISDHAADMVAYINHAASKGLKIIVALHDPAIWRDGTYAASYPTMYADAGNPATGIAFMQYIVGQVKNLSGVWGYYVADEITNADHAALKTYTDAIKAADTAHPRLLIEEAIGTSSCSNNTSTQFDCCDVAGDDYYPVGDTSYVLTTAQVASGIQSFCNAHALGSAMVLQAFSWQQDNSAHCSPYPDCAPFPSYVQMRAGRDIALANMTPRLILWWAYYKALQWDQTGGAWADMQWASNGLGPRSVSSFSAFNA